MNEGQQKFLDYILERVQEGKEEAAKLLMHESFRMQEEGTFNAAEAMAFIPKMLGMLKAEFVDEVKAIMENFGKQQRQ